MYRLGTSIGSNCRPVLDPSGDQCWLCVGTSFGSIWGSVLDPFWHQFWLSLGIRFGSNCGLILDPSGGPYGHQFWFQPEIETPLCWKHGAPCSRCVFLATLVVICIKHSWSVDARPHDSRDAGASITTLSNCHTTCAVPTTPPAHHARGSRSIGILSCLPTTHPNTFHPTTHPITFQLPTQLPSNYPPNYLPTTHPTTHPTTFQLPTQLPSNYPPNYLPTTHPTTHCFSNVSCQIARGSPWVLCQSRHGFPRVPCQSRHGVPHVFLLQRIPLNFILCASRYLQVTLTQQGYEAQRIPSEAQRIGGPANFVPP